MNIQITGRHIEITDSLKQFSENAIVEFEKYNLKIIKVHILLEIQNSIHQKCEINVEGKNLHLNAQCESKNMYESITKCADKIEHQLRDHKSAFNDKKHQVSTKTFEQNLLEKENKEIKDELEEPILA